MAPQTNSNGNATLPVKHNERSMAGESKEDRENGSQAAMVRGNLGPRRATSPTHQNSPTRPQHLQSTPDHQDEVSRLRAELAAAKSEISSLRVELSQQQYELEEVNLIINLQDEVQACKQVIHQQKQQIEQLILAQQQQQKPSQDVFSSSETFSKNAERDGEKETEASGTQDLKEEYRALYARYSELQNNRAWSEFQLRDRICSDSLKYHRRLIHWKSKNQKLEQELVQIKAAHATEIQELQTKWKSTASSVLQHTLRDLKSTQGKVRQLEKELTRIKLEQTEPEIQIKDSSSKFLVKAAKQSNFL